jgi:ABC-type glycerol-3-phosphate transport system substrate-binding protein
MNQTGTILTAILCGTRVLIGGCAPAGAAEDALYQAAKKEGEVVWYTALIVTQAVRPLIAAFNKKYPGIEVRYARADSGPTAIKIITEARAGRVQSDVFDGIDTTPPLVQAGLVEPYVAVEAGRYPPELKDPVGRWNALVPRRTASARWPRPNTSRPCLRWRPRPPR